LMPSRARWRRAFQWISMMSVILVNGHDIPSFLELGRGQS
jgi:hypothetical protein